MQRYLTVGTSSINRELFRNVIPYPSNYSTKPYGGLWLTTFDCINANHWLMYISTRESLFYYKFNEDACIVDLKDDVKILRVASKEDFEEAHNHYPSIFEPLFFSDFIGQETKLLDYELIAKDFDGIYFDYYSIDKNYVDWSVPSLVLFNLDCVQNYTPIKIGYEDILGGYDKYFYVAEEQISRIIEPISQTFLDLYILIEAAYLKFLENNPGIISYESFKDYYSTLFSSIRYFVKTECEKYKSVLEIIVRQTANLNHGDKSYQDFEGAIVYRLLNSQMNKAIDKRKELVAKRTRSLYRESYI